MGDKRAKQQQTTAHAGRRNRQSRSADTGLLECFARCAGGFEDVLGAELRDLGMHRVRPQVGGVIFFGTLSDAYRACLWSRVATRIQLVLARVSCSDADALYQGIYDFPWEDHVPCGATIAVDAHGTNEALRNSKFVALKVKDALCDRLRDRRAARPDVDVTAPDVAINVAIHPQKATVYLNLSGASLHRRGYRSDGVQTEAPLKETLAAGILLAAGWDELAHEGGCLADPMCGSGTLAIEAALMAADVAPGLLRMRWGFERWLGHESAIWEALRAEAQARRGWPQGRPRIVAGDLNARAIDIARANAQRAGVASFISFQVADAADLGRRLRQLRDLPGLVVANPPYGERLLTQGELPAVYDALSAAVEAVPQSWRLALITPDAGIDSALGRVPQRTLACHNGPIHTWVRLYDLQEPRREIAITSLAGSVHKVAVADAGSAQFAARLRKAAKERLRWARRTGVGCCRVYDADLPDFALSVDLYEGSDRDEGRRYVVVEEHRRPAKVDAQRAARRLADAAALAAAVLDIPRTQLLCQPWQDRRDGRPPRDQHPGALPLVVREAHHRFALDLTARPDTGLPLWLRGVRQLAGERARGARVANLFAPAAAASVYAAACGAVQTVSLDPFADRVAMLRQALSDNGLAGKANQVLRADARVWLAREAKLRHRYDLMICVPPAWLAARDGAPEWNLQRDHAALITQAARVLSQRGTIVFACWDRAFALDTAALAHAGLAVEDISAATCPPDLARSARNYHCYLLHR